MRIASERRFALAVASLLVAYALLRPVVATAVVARGDQFLMRADLTGASRYYMRALRVDSDCEVAVDRYLFSQLQMRGDDALRGASRIADMYLRSHASASRIRLDRALVLWARGADTAAASDFMRVAGEARDFRYYALAAHAALRAGDRSLARAAFAQALQLEPRYAIARQYLRIATR
jgi:tetratricopeptide (TPR) repeat protein